MTHEFFVSTMSTGHEFRNPMRRLSQLVAGSALQAPDISVGRVAVSKHVLNLRCEAKHLQRPNAVPVHIDLVPPQPVGLVEEGSELMGKDLRTLCSMLPL